MDTDVEPPKRKRSEISFSLGTICMKNNGKISESSKWGKRIHGKCLFSKENIRWSFDTR